jgi:hypothetical protein
MKVSMKQTCIVAMAMVAVAVTSCKKEDNLTPVPAIIATKTFLVSGSPVGAFNLFSFETGAPVANTDSATTKWDFAMRFEKVIVNSNSSGPGAAGVQVLNSTFDALTTAPETGYGYDTTATQTAVKGTDWYTYNPATRSFSPIAGKLFVFKTATGKYAKMEITSADPADDNGAAVVPPTRPTKIKYTLRYAYQASGSRNF